MAGVKGMKHRPGVVRSAAQLAADQAKLAQVNAAKQAAAAARETERQAQAKDEKGYRRAAAALRRLITGGYDPADWMAPGEERTPDPITTAKSLAEIEVATKTSTSIEGAASYVDDPGEPTAQREEAAPALTDDNPIENIRPREPGVTWRIGEGLDAEQRDSHGLDVRPEGRTPWADTSRHQVAPELFAQSTWPALVLSAAEMGSVVVEDFLRGRGEGAPAARREREARGCIDLELGCLLPWASRTLPVQVRPGGWDIEPRCATRHDVLAVLLLERACRKFAAVAWDWHFADLSVSVGDCGDFSASRPEPWTGVFLPSF